MQLARSGEKVQAWQFMNFKKEGKRMSKLKHGKDKTKRPKKHSLGRQDTQKILIGHALEKTYNSITGTYGEKAVEYGADKVLPGRIHDVDRMYDQLKGFFWGTGMLDALRAMEYMLRRHDGHYRDGGQLYAVHPLGMAKHAMQLYSGYSKFINEALFKTIFLHDVCEDEEREIQELPFDNESQANVDLMTVTRFKRDTKFSIKLRYAEGLCKNVTVVIAKLLDIINNLSSMVGVFPDQKIRKNIVEKDELFMSVFEKAQKDFGEASCLIELLVDEVYRLMDLLALVYGVRLKDENFVNSPNAKSYAYLIGLDETGQCI